MTIFSPSRRVALALSATIVAGCGGGGGIGPIVVPPSLVVTPQTGYETLASTAPVTSALRGAALRANNRTGVVDVAQVSGTLRHDTGGVTLRDGGYNFVDANGPDSRGILSDGSAAMAIGNGPAISQPYEFVSVYTQIYPSGTTSVESIGVVGVVTRTADMPTTGSASYTGEAAAEIVTSTRGVSLQNGVSVVNANFGSGRVDVTMSNFDATDPTTGFTVLSPVDTITVTDMNISGNTFSGGQLTTSDRFGSVNVTGANTTSTASGAFFGNDGAISAPDEVAGVLFTEGDSGSLVGAFLAD